MMTRVTESYRTLHSIFFSTLGKCGRKLIAVSQFVDRGKEFLNKSNKSQSLTSCQFGL